MLERLLDYEREIFFFFNGSDFTYYDHFIWLFSHKWTWIPLGIFILFIMVYKKDWKEVILILLAIVLVILLCDQFASHFCKPFFARYRPTHHPEFMNEVDTVFGYRSGLYGFISSHAANAIGYSLYKILLFRHKWYTFTILVWGIFTAYTRVYLGVHFISDIVFGALAGLVFGYIVYKLYVYSRRRILGKDSPAPETIYSGKDKRIIIYAIWIYIVFIMIFNIPLTDIIRTYL